MLLFQKQCRYLEKQSIHLWYTVIFYSNQSFSEAHWKEVHVILWKIFLTKCRITEKLSILIKQTSCMRQTLTRRMGVSELGSAADVRTIIKCPHCKRAARRETTQVNSQFQSVTSSSKKHGMGRRLHHPHLLQLVTWPVTISAIPL